VPGGGCGTGYCELAGVARTVDAIEKAMANSNTIFFNMMKSFRSKFE
jgi:hypothetical protein